MPFGENNLHQTAYLRKGYLWTKNLKEIDFSFFNCHLLNTRYFLTTRVALKLGNQLRFCELEM